jgi:hypothetical protein
MKRPPTSPADAPQAAASSNRDAQYWAGRGPPLYDEEVTSGTSAPQAAASSWDNPAAAPAAAPAKAPQRAPAWPPTKDRPDAPTQADIGGTLGPRPCPMQWPPLPTAVERGYNPTPAAPLDPRLISSPEAPPVGVLPQGGSQVPRKAFPGGVSANLADYRA